jgi:hypothetical protein
MKVKSEIITEKTRERFCKDVGISLKLFKEPYFTKRLKLYNSYFNTLEKYSDFLNMIKDFDLEQDYFSYYNNVKNEIMEYLGEKEGMKKFKEEDMNKFKIKNLNFPKRDIYKGTNINKTFISIDMVKANFTAIKHYDSSIVEKKETYKEFISMFTKYKHLQNSKYLRQVVFGNHNPKRQTTYEKYLMDNIMDELLQLVKRESIVSFGNDEIVIDITDMEDSYQKNLAKKLIPSLIKSFDSRGIKTRQEYFRLLKIEGTKGYVKKSLMGKKDDFKCLNSIELPFVLRHLSKQEIQKEDKVFLYEGKLAKLLEVPNIRIGGIS